MIKLGLRGVAIMVALVGWYQGEILSTSPCNEFVTETESADIEVCQHTLRHLLAHDSSSLRGWFSDQENASMGALLSTKRRAQQYNTPEVAQQYDQQKACHSWIVETKRSFTTETTVPTAIKTLGDLIPDDFINHIHSEAIQETLQRFKATGDLSPFIDSFYTLTDTKEITEYIAVLGVMFTMIYCLVAHAVSRASHDHDEDSDDSDDSEDEDSEHEGLPSFLQTGHAALPHGTQTGTLPHVGPHNQPQEESGFFHAVQTTVSFFSVFEDLCKLPAMQAIKAVVTLVQEIKKLVNKIQLQTGGNLPAWFKDSWVFIPIAVGIVIIRIAQYFLPFFSTVSSGHKYRNTLSALYHKEYTNA